MTYYAIIYTTKLDIEMTELDYKNLKNKQVTVMGLGLHGGGVSVVKWLFKQGAIVTVTDLKSKKKLQSSLDQIKKLNVNLVLGKHLEKDFKNADLIFKNPGVPKESKFLKIAKQNKIPIESDISLFFRLCPGEIIGITGTKGKSTTTVLVHKFLKSAGYDSHIAGNIRISPLDLLNQLNKKSLVVLELSSWQLEDMAHLKVSPKFAVLTNIFPEHLNRHRNMNQYIMAKLNIFKFQKKSDYAIVHQPSMDKYNIGKYIQSKKFVFSAERKLVQNGCFLQGDTIKFRNNSKEHFVGFTKDIKLRGTHNITNVLAAISVAKIFSVSNTIIKRTLRQFSGIPGRLEYIRSWKGVKFYNDTTATTPESCAAAIDSFKLPIVLIAGGADKKLNYKELAKKISNSVEYAVLFKGTATDKLIIELKKQNYRQMKIVSSMAQAVTAAKMKAQKNQVILLSPGAASFGIFDNEFDRGGQFTKLVKSLA